MIVRYQILFRYVLCFLYIIPQCQLEVPQPPQIRGQEAKQNPLVLQNFVLTLSESSCKIILPETKLHERSLKCSRNWAYMMRATPSPVHHCQLHHTAQQGGAGKWDSAPELQETTHQLHRPQYRGELWSPQMTEHGESPQVALGSGGADESLFARAADEDLQMFELTLGMSRGIPLKIKGF